ncbi:MAG: FAD-dependent thymidylate synthase [Dehalococcoidia bacterium]|nr:FAD-dependent thymidylate synthase [Dehalococcoidia bacterium]
MSTGDKTAHPRRVYPLSTKDLTEEQIAVVFAMTSRRPEPFDEIAEQVSRETAASFHERWVLGYGHASVAEHAVIHMAVENVSRLACDTLEDNRLGSYTEKSSRYQLLPSGYYHVPAELDPHPEARTLYINTCDHLSGAYARAVEGATSHLKSRVPQRDGERDSAYALRIRRQVIDSCRFLLPASTLTNVGVTMNARLMEHAITKLLSSELAEERSLGDDLKDKGREVTPTLIKYAEPNPYLASSREWQVRSSPGGGETDDCHPEAALVRYDAQAEQKVASAFLYRSAGLPYDRVWRMVEDMDRQDRERAIDGCLEGLGDHDAPLRELEMVDYTFEFVMDYGAYREFKRHRMQTYVPQPLTVANGYLTPDLVREAGLGDLFDEAMGSVGEAFHRLSEVSASLAQYVVTHAHRRRFLARMNLRECYHIFKLRTQPQAHFSIRGPVEAAMRQAVETHPALFKHLRLRKFPDWWGDLYGGDARGRA